MKAVVVRGTGGPEAFELLEVPSPGPAAPGTVVVRVVAASLNPVDWKMRSGAFPKPRPYAAGFDLSGVVETAGEGVDLGPGTRVLGMTDGSVGAWAERVAVPAGWLARMPAALSFEEAASLPMGALTAWKALFEVGGWTAPERLLVHGAAGAVGGMAVQLARARGAWVAATARGDGVATARALGADLVVDTGTEDFADAVQRAGGVDLVLDTLGGAVRERSWAALKEGGRVVSVLGATEPPASLADRRLRGLPGFGTGPDGGRLAQVMALVESGRVRPLPVVGFPLAEVARASALAESGRAGGKVVLRVGAP